MKVLQLCHKPPKPAVDGGCIAINTVSEGLLAHGVTLKILTLSTHKHPLELSNYSEDFIEKTAIKGVFVDTKLSIVDAFSNLVTADSYNVSRFFSTDFDILLRKTLEQEDFDIVHVESLFMTTYCHTIKRFSKAKILLRSHNLEYMIWERLAAKTRNPAKNMYIKLLAKQLKKYEVGVFESIDGIIAISQTDADKYTRLGFDKPMIVAPFGVDLEKYPSQPVTPAEYTKDTAIKAFHIGAMDWQPNIEGMVWFIEKIWNALKADLPKLELHLAGRNMPDWMDEYSGKGIHIHGEVNSAIEFMSKHDIMIVPLLSAGGMRVKIIEGMALGKVIIATTIAAEGIDCTNRKNILLADDVNEFKAQLNWLLEDAQRLHQIASNARQFVEVKYDNTQITKNIISFYQKTMLIAKSCG
jgi:glycosyltransferase involved in cell wall biosynthesis